MSCPLQTQSFLERLNVFHALLLCGARCIYIILSFCVSGPKRTDGFSHNQVGPKDRTLTVVVRSNCSSCETLTTAIVYKSLAVSATTARTAPARHDIKSSSKTFTHGLIYISLLTKRRHWTMLWTGSQHVLSKYWKPLRHYIISTWRWPY